MKHSAGQAVFGERKTVPEKQPRPSPETWLTLCQLLPFLSSSPCTIIPSSSFTIHNFSKPELHILQLFIPFGSDLFVHLWLLPNNLPGETLPRLCSPNTGQSLPCPSFPPAFFPARTLPIGLKKGTDPETSPIHVLQKCC